MGTGIAPSDTVYIAVSRDCTYGSKTYAGSGQIAFEIQMSSCAKRRRGVHVVHASQPFDEALRYARANDFNYMVYPTLLRWKERATEWSGFPGRVEVNSELVAPASGETAEAAIISSTTGLGTFRGDDPQDLLPKPVDDFVSGLF